MVERVSGTGAMISRVYVARERHALKSARIDVLADLAARVRELTEAVLHTDAPDDEIAAATAEIAVLTERLSAVRREYPPVAQLDEHGGVRQLASPVGGELNPISPPVHVEILPDGAGVRGEFTLSAVYEGPPTLVHGGVSALILDQALGVAASANGTPGMTATFDLRYRRPTPHSVPLVVEAAATRAEGRKCWVDGRIIGPDGKPTVEATAMFITPRL
ncbi:PaaI family thioesterase [Actinomadura rugatobispora]|uniref:Acyl-coenzyme A thioesterase THEM4 n=1 Tax=Actinomadura rugatobispora TaxID=1994 RepID=A0ABW1AE56_9ACTN|nr:PaaI family thioesterase [Actinomadura rugatobispora]